MEYCGRLVENELSQLTFPSHDRPIPTFENSPEGGSVAFFRDPLSLEDKVHAIIDVAVELFMQRDDHKKLFSELVLLDPVVFYDELGL